jgi:hypothetical protein
LDAPTYSCTALRGPPCQSWTSPRRAAGLRERIQATSGSLSRSRASSIDRTAGEPGSPNRVGSAGIAGLGRADHRLKRLRMPVRVAEHCYDHAANPSPRATSLIRIGHTPGMARIRRICTVTALTAAASLAAAGSAPAATKWLCGPGVAQDPCRPSLSTTFYRGWDTPAGTSTPRRDRDHGVACFYVYPTVSNQQGRLASKRIDPEIRSIALYQAARFSQVCRVYAPVYRQATVPALQAGTTTRRDYLTAYGDVEHAFDAFLRRIGRHRGFVLLGHSQGSFHLERLIRRRIDTHRALRRRMVSAVVLGGDVTVHEKSDRGGTFRRVPTCRRATQLSCVLAFSTFNETPPEASVFGRGASRFASFLGLPDGPKLETACTNPAALGSGRSARLTSVVPTQPFAPGTLIAAGISLLGLQWPAASTTFVQSNGAFTGRCSRAGGAHVLRIASAPGTPVPKASPTPDWGLHLVDVNIAQGDIVKVLRSQIRAYADR